MTAIYCPHCKVFTATKSEKLITTPKGRHRLTGICSICGSKKGTFASRNKEIIEHTEDEREDASIKRANRYATKKAIDIGLAVLGNAETKEYVKKAIPTLKWPR